ncbi:MAG: hypothetical protein KDA88_09565 [Planctomycetaceae bacterium]|nr:hypothetical protein [Planctomycetaceae bacterium]
MSRELTMLGRASLGVLLVLALPAVGHAQIGWRPGCGCQRPAPVVSVPIQPVAPVCLPQPMVQTQLRPVVEMRYQPQQVTTYQNVVRTEIRREQQIVSVPVTTTRQVQVDEGSYQMVWVPKVVTKNVQETVMQRQVQERNVPYQVVQRIPQVQTQLIPQQTVRYVPEQRVVYGSAPALGYVAPQATIAAVPNTPLAPIAMSPTAQAEPTPTAPAAQTADNSGEWKTIPQRQAAADQIQQQSYETSAAVNEVPRRIFPVTSAPTAVQVWQQHVIR